MTVRGVRLGLALPFLGTMDAGARGIDLTFVLDEDRDGGLEVGLTVPYDRACTAGRSVGHSTTFPEKNVPANRSL